ncbi:FAD-dependent oxidoreductase [Cocleimonas flava]
MMKNKTDVLIMGGGIAGVSTLYHLTKLGWTDVMLTEKLDLTSGSTWHAAGNLPHFSNSFNVMKMQQHSIALYARLEEETGHPVDHHPTGAVRLAHTEERMNEFERVVAMSKLAGLDLEMISVERLVELYPYLNPEGVLGGLWDPADGHIDPTSATNAMAKGAKDAGATIVRQNPVEKIVQKEDGRWEVTTPKGIIDAGIIVNAGGFRANELAKMVGHELPMCSMEHQFLVTDSIPELEGRDEMLPMLRDPDVSYYLRQEGKGFILGPYEPDGIPWATDGVPKEFGQELLAPDLDRIEDIMMTAMTQVELVAEGGIKTVVNGPITYSPDGHPLVGPVHGIDNYFVITGFNFGIAQGGGAGHFMAQWIVDGEPELDLFELDPRRFGDYADIKYTVAKGTEVYANEYQLGYANEYAMRPAVRGQKKTPIYESHKADNAVFGAYFGWERPSWFAPEGMEPVEQHSFRRGNWFDPVAAECKNVQENVGLLDLSPFTKFEVSGEGAYDYLSNIMPNHVPTEPGQIVLAHPLSPSGGVAWEVSITMLQDGRYYMMSPAALEIVVDDWLFSRLPKDGSVTLKNTTKAGGCLLITGPNARKVLSKVTDVSLSNADFPWFTGQEIDVAGVPTRALRMSFVGELGWELHHPVEYTQKLYDALHEAGAEFDIKNFGLRAMDSMRFEKGYPVWGPDMNTEFTALESGLSWFIKMDKDFEGKDILLKQKEAGFENDMVMIEVDSDMANANKTDAQNGFEPLYLDGEIVGQCSSGGYGNRIQKSLAFAFIKTKKIDKKAENAGLTVQILGKHYPAKIVPMCNYDPKNERIKADD